MAGVMMQRVGCRSLNCEVVGSTPDWHCCISTLGKLFALFCLYCQAVQFGTGVRVVMAGYRRGVVCIEC